MTRTNCHASVGRSPLASRVRRQVAAHAEARDALKRRQEVERQRVEAEAKAIAEAVVDTYAAKIKTRRGKRGGAPQQARRAARDQKLLDQELFGADLAQR